jgi:3-phosphoshikimate 1-carboxyvinyltransferase
MASASKSDVPYGPVRGGKVAGRLRLPGSKSITQRHFNLALVYRQPLLVRQPLFSEDTTHYLEGLEAAGFAIDRHGHDVALAPGPAPAGEIPIFCGAGGTMFRFLTAALTAVPGTYRLDGIARLRERPISQLVDALRQLGARIDYLGRDGFAPLRLFGGSLSGGRAVLDAGISSQFLSAVLMAALGAAEPCEIELAALTSEPYVDLTLDAIAAFGGRVERSGESGPGVYRVWPGRAGMAPAEITVEPDYSAVGYPAAAAALTGGEVFLEDLSPGSRQGDRGFVDLLAQMGAELSWQDGGLLVRGAPGGRLVAIDADLEAMPDQVPTLAALAPFARGVTAIRNVPNLRVKESDRLAAMTSELRRAGATVEELADGLVIPGVWADSAPPSEPVLADSWGDHRIAMAMALVGLRRPGLSVAEPAVVGKSYPEFWHDLESLLPGER